MYKSIGEVIATLDKKYQPLADAALTQEFMEAYGGSSHHHNWKGGLYDHTLEVLNGCDAMCGPTIKRDILLTAAIWHDFNKIKEYELDLEGKIVKTEFLYKYGHVATSGIEMTLAANKVGFDDLLAVNEMFHIILSHHGRFEWGSPAEPRTPEAWILHSNDMLSSRGLLKAKA